MVRTLLRLLVACGSLAVLIPTSPRVVAEELAVITVEAGETTRTDVPVSVDLPRDINEWRMLRLVEVQGDARKPVPSQIEPGKPAKLWWVLGGTTPAGAKREFELLRGAPVPAIAGGESAVEKKASSAGVQIELAPTTLDARIDGALLFRYNHAHVVPPDGIGAEFTRSGYIQPMFSPSGILLTEDFPSDHAHHKGIWMPWTGTEFEGKPLDFWNLGSKQGTVQFAGFESVECGAVYGRFQVRHEHLDLRGAGEPETVLEEVWDVRIWSNGGPAAGYWVWDITSTQTCVADTPLHLKAYRYGGLGWRGPASWKGDGYQILTSEGKVRKDSHATRSRWCAHSGDTNGKRSTVVVLCHPGNERFPEPMRTWDNGMVFFNYVPPQKEPMDLEPGKPHVFRYRFYIYEGGIDRGRAEGAWADYGSPPRVSITSSR